MPRLARVAGVIALLALAGCASSPPGATTTTSRSTGATTGPPGTNVQAQGSTSSSSASSWVISGITTYAPADAPGEAASPDPNFDFGYVVQIVDGAFHPRELVAGCCRPVTWKNLTSKPAEVDFDHQLVKSGPIPPGGTFVYNPTTPVSITYHSGLDPAETGHLQIQQEFDS